MNIDVRGAPGKDDGGGLIQAEIAMLDRFGQRNHARACFKLREVEHILFRMKGIKVDDRRSMQGMPSHFGTEELQRIQAEQAGQKSGPSNEGGHAIDADAVAADPEMGPKADPAAAAAQIQKNIVFSDLSQFSDLFPCRERGLSVEMNVFFFHLLKVTPADAKWVAEQITTAESPIQKGK